MKEVLSSIVARLLSAKKRYLLGGVILLGLAFNAASDSANFLRAFVDILIESKTLDSGVDEVPRGDGQSFPLPTVTSEDAFLANQ